MQLLVARASMISFVIFDYAERFAEGATQLATWLHSGELRSFEHVVRGEVKHFPDTFLKLFRGENTGKHSGANTRAGPLRDIPLEPFNPESIDTWSSYKIALHW